jgi:hypothetical protein
MNSENPESIQKIIDELILVAQNSPHTMKHAAGLLLRRNKPPIVSACNEPRTCYDGQVHRCSGHAEFMACWRGRSIMRRNTKAKSFDLFVIRIIHKSNAISLAESRPCNDCIRTMIDFGIHRVYYSTSAGTINCQKVVDMPQTYDSKMYAKYWGNS